MKTLCRTIAVSSLATLFLAGCGTLDDVVEGSNSTADQSVASAFAHDDPRIIRARAGGTDIGLTQRSTAADGTVVFHAEAPLLPEDQNVHEDIYLKTPDGELTRITRAYTGAETNNASLYPCISDDGNIVAFCSRADNLVPGDVNGDWDVFVYNRTTEQLSLVSVDNSGVQGERGSLLPSLSADGTRVTFVSRATLTPEKASTSRQDIFLRNLSTGTTTLVSHDGGGGSGNSHSYDPVLSGDGTCVAYASRSTNLVTGDTNGRQDIFCYDATTGITTRITDGNSHSYWPSLSTDGSLVGFTSYASNLVAGDTNARRDIFTWDGAEFKAVTHGDNHAGRCVVNGAETRISFDSLAENLVADGNGQSDVFMAELSDVAGTLERVTDGIGSRDQASMSWEGTQLSYHAPGGEVSSVLKPLCPYPGFFAGFGGRQDYDTSYRPAGSAVGDIDLDGDLDVVTVNDEGYGLYTVLLNDGTGKFSEAGTYNPGGVADFVEMGDLNGDGYPDIVLGRSSASGFPSAYLNQQDGTFQYHTQIGHGDTSSARVRDVALGDVDNDGDIDCAIVTGSKATIARNDGNGNFPTGYVQNAPFNPYCVELGDINGDGYLDLVTSANGFAAIAYITDSNGDIVSSVVAHDGGDQSNRALQSIAVVDIDGDGDNDIVGAAIGLTQEVAVFYNSSGSFNTSSLTSATFGALTGGFPNILDAVDVDSDGDIDIATIQFDGSRATLYTNDGFGNLSQTAATSVGGNPGYLHLVDLTGDFYPDLVTSNLAYGGISVVPNDEGQLSIRPEIAMAASPKTASVLDIDGDGHLDLATANNGYLYLRRGDGNGDFLPVETIFLWGGNPNATSSGWGDLNGDGVADFAASLTGSVNQGFSVGLSNGSGWTPNLYGSGKYLYMSILDIDGDGDNDCVGKLTNPGSLSVSLNNGNGQFAPEQSYPIGGDRLEYGDLNGDGDIDVASTRSILLNNGDGTFATEVVYETATPYQESVALGDLDGDGDLDIARAQNGSVRLYLNDGSAVFTFSQQVSTNASHHDIEILDLDGDGDRDLAIASADSNSIVTLLNDGAGGFTDKTSFGVGAGPIGLVSIDYDSDGDLDILTVNLNGSGVSLLLNQTCTCDCE